ncbi:flavoprotein [Solwaraspora sp. WMMD1047]|uniref:flavoprotein n=1 Tax=Solwaraspora sp. WMMD1047 TaxID=3016102 RepID=UPI002417F431|nr:flavoprotein [Solwaraspora sp. WMMD1047]MDG4829992.1 flavoprotein [Solwaraspora sp. WMMD1047]
MTDAAKVVLLVVCAAPPAAEVAELVERLQDDGWDVYPVMTDAATAWIEPAALERATGHPVKRELRGPQESKSLPRADAIVVAPATFNTINQWAAGINNTAALGILNEALGANTPIVASPYAKAVLAAHPAFQRNLELLARAGVRFTATDALRPVAPDGPFQWEIVSGVLREVRCTTGASVGPGQEVQGELPMPQVDL